MGMILGILIMNIGKGILLEETGLFDEDILYRMKYMTVDSDALFCYVLRKRMLILLGIAVLTTTYLGLATCMGSICLCGMSMGLYLTALTVRYGIKGLFLAFVGIFPQAICYVPALLLLWGWSESVYRLIYEQKVHADISRKDLWNKLSQLVVIGVIVVIGCLLEGYVNTGILRAYLKIF